MDDNVTCPECGEGKLKLRDGRYGAFYGCTNYPECDFTCNEEDIEEGGKYFNDDTRGGNI